MTSHFHSISHPPAHIHRASPLLTSPLAVTIELATSGLFGGGSVGRVKVPVHECLERRHIRQSYGMEGGGRAEVELTWKPYFG